MQFFITILSEIKIVIGILLVLAIHGIANAAIPHIETAQGSIMVIGCGKNIIDLDQNTQNSNITQVCRALVIGRDTPLLTINYSNGINQNFAIIKDRVISESGNTAIHELTLKSYGSDGVISGSSFLALETVQVADKISDETILQIKGSTLTHVSFDARLFKSLPRTPAQTDTL